VTLVHQGKFTEAQQLFKKRFECVNAEVTQGMVKHASTLAKLPLETIATAFKEHNDFLTAQFLLQICLQSRFQSVSFGPLHRQTLLCHLHQAEMFLSVKDLAETDRVCIHVFEASLEHGYFDQEYANKLLSLSDACMGQWAHESTDYARDTIAVLNRLKHTELLKQFKARQIEASCSTEEIMAPRPVVSVPRGRVIVIPCDIPDACDLRDPSDILMAGLKDELHFIAELKAELEYSTRIAYF
jgi:hypothetical protein